MTGGSADGLSSPGKHTVTEQLPSTYVGPPSTGPTGPGKHTLVQALQARIGYGPAAAVQASPASKPTSPGDDQPIAPAIPGIDKAGFIDHSEGSFLRTGPRELGAGTVRPEPLPPATRVFVSGTHPKAPEWWYVTAFVDQQLVRGYVQGPRVNTDLPEPLAELREVTGTDTAEGFAREKFGDAVTDGHDLRYYENVLLFVNQQRDCAGITGTYQDPGILGGGGNNVQLVAGHRIWLVSAQYAKALQSVVPSGSLTGGAVAKAKRFVGHLEDILHSVTESRNHLDEVGGEYTQAIRDHEAAIVGIVAAFITAEAVSMFAAASPTGVGQAVAMVLQLALSAFGAAGMAEAGVQALEHGSAWLNTAWTAKGNKNQIALASKQFLKMLVSIAMAALSFLGARGNYRNLVKIGGSMPTGGLPAFATAGASGPGGAGAATGVAIGPGTGAIGVGGAMMVKHEGEGSHDETAPSEAKTADSSQLPPRKPFTTKDGVVVDAVERGRAVVPTAKVESYLRGKAKPFTPEMAAELRALKQERQTARKAFDANPEKASRIEQLERLQHNHQRSVEMSNSLAEVGLPDTGAANAEILQHLLEVGQQITEGNRIRFRSELAGAHGRIELLSTWVVLPDGRVVLSTLNVIPQ